MEDPVISKIKNQFDKKGNPAKIPLMSGKHFFEARSETDGVYVDNLKTQPFLPWEIFSEAINCIRENGGKTKKGNATNSRLGDSNLGLDTLEGHIASKVYGCRIGDTVFKRVNSIASILAWAGVCENTRGHISLLSNEKELQVSHSENEVSPAFSAEENRDGSGVNSLCFQPDSRQLELENLEEELEEKIRKIKALDEQAATRDEELGRLREELERHEKLLLERDLELRALQEKLTDKSEEAINLESSLIEKEEKIESLTEELREKTEKINALDEKLSAKEKEIEDLGKNISIKDKDLKTLAEEVIAKAGEMRKIEEKLSVKERKINTMEAMLATAEEKLKKLEKQLSGYEGEEKLAVQLREREEFIKQLKGTLASKEEAFSKISEENRKYRMQQKLASEGLKQIEEQKASRKWWKRL
ncbi:chromosome segregation ATPase [Methanosarcina sp. MSH10X1]|uniref:chromosome segregation ATPase n=1 Tax=Methanosarcina sp. MSH10X1 TaxID=2507075 RepID=UPI000FFB5707|nr:chromosome segregation ATPase [Methanosarcina sp. MSH10X1]RXA19599.1 chromosome segregation ATPase [Methanosarcina sp. MSH10X1]